MSDHAPVNLPNFLVIGAQRAGTTLLHQLLATHPEVYVPFQRKELHYFDRYFERGDAGTPAIFPMSATADATWRSARSHRTIWPTPTPRAASTPPCPTAA